MSSSKNGGGRDDFLLPPIEGWLFHDVYFREKKKLYFDFDLSVEALAT